MSALGKLLSSHTDSQPLAFLMALVLAFFITPIIRRWAEKINYTRKSECHHDFSPLKNSLLNRRKENKQSKSPARLGGIAIFVSLIITIVFYLLYYGRFTPKGIPHLELEAMSVGAVIIFAIGLIDDFKPLCPKFKLMTQILAASTTWFMGLKIEFLANPLHYINIGDSSAINLNDISSYLVTVLFLVAITNAINLIDGIDGLACGTCLIVALATWAITLSPILYQPAGAILAAIIAGSCFGFLRYNFNPARIFLGDSGAYLLGFALACMSCIGLVKKVTVVILFPIIALILAVPLIDISFAVIRRLINKKSLIKPDTGHIHHILLAKGLSTKQINYLFYLISFIGGLLATWILGKEILIHYLQVSLSIVGIWIVFSLGINYRKQKFS